jgi:hypothetical protein
MQLKKAIATVQTAVTSVTGVTGVTGVTSVKPFQMAPKAKILRRLTTVSESYSIPSNCYYTNETALELLEEVDESSEKSIARLHVASYGSLQPAMEWIINHYNAVPQDSFFSWRPSHFPSYIILRASVGLEIYLYDCETFSGFALFDKIVAPATIISTSQSGLSDGPLALRLTRGLMEKDRHLLDFYQMVQSEEPIGKRLSSRYMEQMTNMLNRGDYTAMMDMLVDGIERHRLQEIRKENKQGKQS